MRIRTRAFALGGGSPGRHRGIAGRTRRLPTAIGRPTVASWCKHASVRPPPPAPPRPAADRSTTCSIRGSSALSAIPRGCACSGASSSVPDPVRSVKSRIAAMSTARRCRSRRGDPGRSNGALRGIACGDRRSDATPRRGDRGVRSPLAAPDRDACRRQDASPQESGMTPNAPNNVARKADRDPSRGAAWKPDRADRPDRRWEADHNAK